MIAVTIQKGFGEKLISGDTYCGEQQQACIPREQTSFQWQELEVTSDGPISPVSLRITHEICEIHKTVKNLQKKM